MSPEEGKRKSKIRRVFLEQFYIAQLVVIPDYCSSFISMVLCNRSGRAR